MYEVLTAAELNALQGMLFRGTEDAYRMASFTGGNPGLAERYGSVHRELGHLFIEVGTELLLRLDCQVNAATTSSPRAGSWCPPASSRPSRLAQPHHTPHMLGTIRAGEAGA